jgi:protein tyrosine/serine phosphatase
VTARALALLLLFLSAGPASAASVSDVSGAVPIKRFEQVSSNLYRGAQPDAGGFVFLRDAGIRTVISLRNDDSERALVEALGIRFVHIPVTFHPLVGNEIPLDSALRFLETVDDPASGPVFLHCRRGADRTGAFVALYRLARQGWEIDRAFDEARAHGMRWWYSTVKSELKRLSRALRPAGGSRTLRDTVSQRPG